MVQIQIYMTNCTLIVLMVLYSLQNIFLSRIILKIVPLSTVMYVKLIRWYCSYLLLFIFIYYLYVCVYMYIYICMYVYMRVYLFIIIIIICQSNSFFFMCGNLWNYPHYSMLIDNKFHHFLLYNGYIIIIIL